ncbi:MAG: hypothetical protein M0036_13655 [Desulfobacteraceae bacterium]|nr:hypothetical protein [Desulfobacteraceae bacterium]
MRIRNFLVIHSSRSIRSMVKRHILADLDDVEIVEASNGQEALRELCAKPFDLVICDGDLEDMPITAFRQEMTEAAFQKRAITIIALAGSVDDAGHLAQKNFEHIVALPFKPVEFVDTINQVCNPRKMRNAHRYHIPNSKVVISVWGMEAEAVLINISQGGVLVEVSGDRSDLLLQDDPRLAIKTNIMGCNYHIKTLPVKLSRLNVVAWNENYKPTLMRLAYSFLELKEEARSELTQILQMAEEDGLFASEEQGGSSGH